MKPKRWIVAVHILDAPVEGERYLTRDEIKQLIDTIDLLAGVKVRITGLQRVESNV